MRYKTREEWLIAAVEQLKPMIESKGRKLPPVRVSTGWPSSKALSKQGTRHVGECWSPECSVDKHTEIFISPWLDKVTDPNLGVLETLLHEMVHAAVGVECGHKGAFIELAGALGFQKPWKSTPSGPELDERMKSVAELLGPYPHAQLDRTKDKTKKKQTTRMIKAECMRDECGYTVRLSRKWLDEVGAPHCPKHGEMHFEIPAELAGDDSE